MNFSKKLQSYIKRVNNTLRFFIKKQPMQDASLVEAMYYGMLSGGKRIRPFLVYAIGEMLEVNLSVLDIPAAAVECIHTYSLIHDDLPSMDNHNLRRGLPTCHIKFGEANAILAGDALQTLAFSILSDLSIATNITDGDRLSMISELAAASGASGMCGGQALDLKINKNKINIAQLNRIYTCKTGTLICAAIRLGAFSAGKRGRKILPILDRYAKNIGLAFQIQDDILDVISNTKLLGKHQGADKKRCKKTYPALLGLNQAQYRAQHLISKANQALQELKSLNTSMLEALANYIIERSK